MENNCCGAGSAASLIKGRSEKDYASLLSYSQLLLRRHVSPHDSIHQLYNSTCDPARRPFVSMQRASSMSFTRAEAEGFAESDAASASCSATAIGSYACIDSGGGDGCPNESCFEKRERSGGAHEAAAATSCRNAAFTRTCKLCGTSKTPLWRSGPLGAKSLCNACGIRSKKARRSAAADLHGGDIRNKQEELNSSVGVVELPVKRKKHGVARDDQEGGAWFSSCKKHRRLQLKPRKRPDQPLAVNHTTVFVPRNNNRSPGKAESSSCVTSRGTPSPAHHHTRISSSVHKTLMSPRRGHAHDHDDIAFARDEEQAAFLLMALSCGLVLA